MKQKKRPPWYTLAMLSVSLDREKVIIAKLPTRFGDFDIFGFENETDGEQALAIVSGDLEASTAPLVRIHSQCFTGDTLHSLRCDCGEQLERALALIAESGTGVLIYQMQEGRGIGLMNKLRAYQLQDQGVDTVDANLQLGFEADLRSYQFCAEILRYLGVSSVRLMSNNPDKIRGLEEEGIQVVERVPLLVDSSPFRSGYLQTKKEKMGHLLD
jgi:3,4-dihydroxy 2-butanone 4-phosphate synthase/GTP cyclohydrolase II